MSSDWVDLGDADARDGNAEGAREATAAAHDDGGTSQPELGTGEAMHSMTSEQHQQQHQHQQVLWQDVWVQEQEKDQCEHQDQHQQHQHQQHQQDQQQQQQHQHQQHQHQDQHQDQQQQQQQQHQHQHQEHQEHQQHQQHQQDQQDQQQALLQDAQAQEREEEQWKQHQQQQQHQQHQQQSSHISEQNSDVLEQQATRRESEEIQASTEESNASIEDIVGDIARICAGMPARILQELRREEGEDSLPIERLSWNSRKIVQGLKWTESHTKCVVQEASGAIVLKDVKDRFPPESVMLGVLVIYKLYDVERAPAIRYTGSKRGGPDDVEGLNVEDILEWKDQNGRIYRRSESGTGNLTVNVFDDCNRFEFKRTETPKPVGDSPKEAKKHIKEKLKAVYVRNILSSAAKVSARRKREAMNDAYVDDANIKRPRHDSSFENPKAGHRGAKTHLEGSDDDSEDADEVSDLDNKSTTLCIVISGAEPVPLWEEELAALEACAKGPFQVAHVNSNQKLKEAFDLSELVHADALHILGKRSSKDSDPGAAFMNFSDGAKLTNEELFSFLEKWANDSRRPHQVLLSLSICDTESLGQSVAQSCMGNLRGVVCVPGSLDAQVAVDFFPSLYQMLNEGETLRDAFKLATANARATLSSNVSSNRDFALPALLSPTKDGSSWMSVVDVDDFRARAQNLTEEKSWERRVLLASAQAEEFAKAMAVTEVYRPIHLRDYQQHLVSSVLQGFAEERNSVVYLPTGAGKTAVAAIVMHRLKLPFSVFVVPTVVLVYQQARAIEETTCLRVARACGGLHTNAWHELRASFDVVCITYGMLQDFIAENPGDVLESIDFLVLDECHHARAKHGYAKLLAKFAQLPRRPPCLGLTAKFVNKAKIADGIAAEIRDVLKNIGMVRDEKDSHTVKPARLLISPGVRERRIDVVTEEVDALTKARVQEIADTFEDSIREKVDPKVWGSELEYALTLKTPDHNQVGIVGLDPIFHDVRPILTPAVETLLKILRENPSRDEADAPARSVRTLVFVERREEVGRLFRLLEREVCNECPWVRPGMVMGSSEQSWSKQLEEVRKFRLGTTTVLLGTTAIQEGFDIRNCNRVIMLSAINSSSDLVQSRGRARMEGSTLTVIGDSGNLEKYKNIVNREELEAKVIEAVARTQVP